MKSLLQSFLLHVCLAGWVLLLVSLGFEWLVPGAVSTHVKLYPLLGAWFLFTCLAAPWFAEGSRWACVSGWGGMSLGALGALGLFAVRTQTPFVYGVIGLVACSLVGLALAYFFARGHTDRV